ncbi:MAG: hypothetical protein U1E31_00565 [Rickettsiales bacterium]
MINKILKISQLIALTTIFSVTNVFANSTMLDDTSLQQAKGLVNDAGIRLKSMALNADHEGGMFNTMFITVRGSASEDSAIQYQVFTAKSTSPDFDIFGLVNPKGSKNTGAMFNETGIYIKFSDKADSNVPLLLRGKIIAIIAKHGNFNNGLAASKKLLANDFKCYTDINGLDRVATFSGENITETSTVNLLMFSKLTEDEMRFLSNCEKKSFSKFNIVETDQPMIITDKPSNLNIRISAPNSNSNGSNSGSNTNSGSTDNSSGKDDNGKDNNGKDNNGKDNNGKDDNGKDNNGKGKDK